LPEYKSQKKDVSEWYWGDRMEKWEEMSVDLYGSNPDEKNSRFGIFREAIAYATQIYECKLIESGDNEELLKRHYLYEPKRKQIEKHLKINTASSEEFWQKFKAFVKSQRPECERIAQKWREKYEFVTPRVWEQACKDAAAEFDIKILQAAIYQLTPQTVRDADDKVKKIKRDLDRIWPEWNNIHKELKPIVDRIVNEQILSLMNNTHVEVTSVKNTKTVKSNIPSLLKDNTHINNKPVEAIKKIEGHIENNLWVNLKNAEGRWLWIAIFVTSIVLVIVVIFKKINSKK